MQEIDTTQLRNQLQRIADLGKKGIVEKQTMGEFLLTLHKELLPENDLDYKFYEWMYKNRIRLREACKELDIDIPEGDNLYKRLKDAVMPKLEMLNKW